MIETIRRMSSHEREVIADVAVLVACASFLLGYTVHIYTQDTKQTTWQDVINSMPAKIKEDIAIDYCVAHKRLCRNLPLSSPIQPLDSRAAPTQ